MNNCTFSIVTAVRNEQKNILKTLQTTRSQILHDNIEFTIEHIIVDGISTDGSIDIIKSFILENSNLERISYKFISETDSGIYDAMEKGRFLASGDFAFFLNAGDIFSSTYTLQKLYEFILRSESLDQIYYGNVVIQSEFISWKRPYKTPFTNKPHRIINIKEIPHHQSIFFPRKFYQFQSYHTEFIKFGETDYTLRACDLFPASYCSLDITKIVLGGFSSRSHSRKEAYEIYTDYLKLLKNIQRSLIDFR
jgi:putative colanic acid biosynthesis glycosyltransferase